MKNTSNLKHVITLILIVIVFPILSNAQTNLQRHRGIAPNLKAANSLSDTVDILKLTISLNITDFTTNIIKGNTAVAFAAKQNGVQLVQLDLLKLTVDSVKQANVTLAYSYNDTLLKITLPAILNVGDTSSLVVYYHGAPVIDASGWGGFYFQNGYAYNLGVGFDALPHTYGRVWFPCFDNFVERSKYEFNITTNAGKIAYCNGYLANDTTDINGLRTRKWIMNEEIPSYLASVSVAAYTQVNKTYNGLQGAVPIVLTALPTDTTNVKNSFVNLNLALATFENRFGPYKWNRVGFCMVPFNSGAMEHATNISYPRTTANGSLQYQTLWAHELSHHWFGDLATCRTAEDMWLNEGWARYCEFIFTEALSGYGSYISNVKANHLGNLQFLQHSEGGFQSLSNIPQNITYGDHVYNKGADIAHTLRGYLGDSLFFHSVKTHLNNNNFKDVSSADFRDELSAASGVQMNDFFDNWVFNPGWPHFSIDSTVVVPNGSNYDVTVFVKQKLYGAPNLFSNVPLELTFKAANWTEQTKLISASGAQSSYNFTLPFNPVFTAINKGDKISQAIASDFLTIKTTGSKSFATAKLTMSVLAVSDSAFVRVEHHYSAPENFQTLGMPYRLSPNHYWTIDGIIPTGFRAKSTLNYDGRTSSFSGNMWQDNQLINTFEDSLVLMYRKDISQDWRVFPYYTKNFVGSNNDKRGTIVIDSFMRGDYVFAIRDYTLGINSINSKEEKAALKLFPNPSNDSFTIDLYASLMDVPERTILIITDVSGKQVLAEKLTAHQNIVTINTANIKSGTYLVTLKNKETILRQSKFIVSH
jgi:Peptidase family M1 domain/Secretion system C-terminal sorting domain/Peptidase M1 N-terminal domain